MKESDPLDWVAKEEPSLEEAREAVGMAKMVRAFARRWLGLIE